MVLLAVVATLGDGGDSRSVGDGGGGRSMGRGAHGVGMGVVVGVNSAT